MKVAFYFILKQSYIIFRELESDDSKFFFYNFDILPVWIYCINEVQNLAYICILSYLFFFAILTHLRVDGVGMCQDLIWWDS